MKYDFSGWATKFNIRCADGRTIKPGAFRDCDGKKVPVVWGHDHSGPDKVLGHALLKCKPEGVYSYIKLNSTSQGQNARKLVKDGDIEALSIFANNLSQRGGDVVHGIIREVSLVLAGANPGALIDNPSIAHGDMMDICADEAIIYYDAAEDDIFLAHGDADEDEDVEDDDVEDDEDYEDDDVEDDEDYEDDDVEDDEDYEDDDVEDDEDYEDDDVEDDEDYVEHDALDEDESEMSEEEIAEIYDNLNEDQQYAVNCLVGAAYSAGANSNNTEDEEGDEEMAHHAFFSENNTLAKAEFEALQHDAMSNILQKAIDESRDVKSVADEYLAHDETAATYGIDNIDLLFPDAKAITDTPSFIKRETAWVAKVMNGTTHVPFSRIKALYADITAEEARAKGYVKGDEKIEEVFPLLSRSVDPQTVYKLQQLDRDDIVDITSFDVVVWLKAEMRIMLDEELSRAFLIGDGRPSTSKQKIKPDHIKPIYGDDSLYTIYRQYDVTSDMDENDRANKFIRETIKARKDYRGSGNITAFMTEDLLTDCLLITDKMGRDIYDSADKLARKLRVNEIVTVPVMENVSRQVTVGNQVVTYELDAILIDLKDYRVGADKGGAVSMFDDFNIKFNQYQYLIETRCSAMNCVPYSAIVVEHRTVTTNTAG